MKYVIACFLSLLISMSVVAESPTEPTQVTVSGIVRDKSSKKKIENASISVPNTRIGTVTNADGFFSLKVPASAISAGIKAEQLGYVSTIVKHKEGKFEIWLVPDSKMLKEVVVKGGDPLVIVREALNRIPQNYSQNKNLYSGFYRETIQKGKRYIGVSEGIVDVYKTPYNHRYSTGERVQVLKGRRIISQKSSDTVAVKILGGPTMPVVMDFVKNEDFLFTEKELDYYRFEMEAPASVDNRLQFVVHFRPAVKVDYPLCEGMLYIDQETLSFSRAEFHLDVSDKGKATRAVLRHKPLGLRFSPQEVSFVVTYREMDGKSYLNYISCKTRFKCDWKRRLFSSGYTTYAEMVMVDRQDEPFEAISRKDAFGTRDIFYDEVDNYWDSNFWRGYNIIEPTESLENAVNKLRNANVNL